MRSPEPWSAQADPDIVVISHGHVPPLEAERVAGAVRRLFTRRRIEGGARVRLSGPNCDAGPMLVQVNFRVRDTPARIQTITPGGGNVLHALVRLEQQIEWLSKPWQPRPWPDPAPRRLAVPEEGVITRRKSYPLLVDEPTAAVVVMDAMDYDAHLFTDGATGEDAVVYRAGPSGLQLARQHRMHPPQRSGTAAAEPVPLTVNPHPTPTLTEAGAVEWLCGHGLPFVFFTDAATGRGPLLYRRYDGDLGLITAADVDTAAPAS